MFLAAFLLSLTIEITQLLTRVGSFDVDDLILNTAGGIAGYLLFYIMNKIRSKWDGALIYTASSKLKKDRQNEEFTPLHLGLYH